MIGIRLAVLWKTWIWTCDGPPLRRVAGCIQIIRLNMILTGKDDGHLKDSFLQNKKTVMLITSYHSQNFQDVASQKVAMIPSNSDWNTLRCKDLHFSTWTCWQSQSWWFGPSEACNFGSILWDDLFWMLFPSRWYMDLTTAPPVVAQASFKTLFEVWNALKCVEHWKLSPRLLSTEAVMRSQRSLSFKLAAFPDRRCGKLSLKTGFAYSHVATYWHGLNDRSHSSSFLKNCNEDMQIWIQNQ